MDGSGVLWRLLHSPLSGRGHPALGLRPGSGHRLGATQASVSGGDRGYAPSPPGLGHGHVGPTVTVTSLAAIRVPRPGLAPGRVLL